MNKPILLLRSCMCSFMLVFMRARFAAMISLSGRETDEPCRMVSVVEKGNGKTSYCA